MTDTVTADQIEAEVAGLSLPHFDEVTAFHLGSIIVRIASAEKMPIVVNIRNASRVFFHAALPGSSGMNDNWARRKSNTALITQQASMAVTLQNAARGITMAVHGLDSADYAESGGAVPVTVAGSGMVAVATVSGLPQLDDHKLVVRALRELMAELA